MHLLWCSALVCKPEAMVVATDATKHHLSLKRETFSSPLVVGKLPLRGGAMFGASFSSTKWHDPIQRSKTCRQSQCWWVQLFNVRPWGPESEYDDIGVAGNLTVTSLALGSLDVLVCSLLHQHVSHHNKLLWSFASHHLFGNSNAGGT